MDMIRYAIASKDIVPQHSAVALSGNARPAAAFRQ
jgi:hypothetical protein